MGTLHTCCSLFGSFLCASFPSTTCPFLCLYYNLLPPLLCVQSFLLGLFPHLCSWLGRPFLALWYFTHDILLWILFVHLGLEFPALLPASPLPSPSVEAPSPYSILPFWALLFTLPLLHLYLCVFPSPFTIVLTCLLLIHSICLGLYAPDLYIALPLPPCLLPLIYPKLLFSRFTPFCLAFHRRTSHWPCPSAPFAPQFLFLPVSPPPVTCPETRFTFLPCPCPCDASSYNIIQIYNNIPIFSIKSQ